MQLTLLKGYPDAVGRRQIFCGYGTGPASYSQTTGDVLSVPRFQFQIDTVFQSMSVSKLYEVRFYPGGTGARQSWIGKWYVISTGAEVANAVNLSGESIQIGGFGGQY